MRLGRDIVGKRLLGQDEVVDAGIDSVQVQLVDAVLFARIQRNSVVFTLVSVEGQARMPNPGPAVHEVSGAKWDRTGRRHTRQGGVASAGAGQHD